MLVSIIRLYTNRQCKCEYHMNETNVMCIEAEMAKNRIVELRQQDFQRRREELIFNQTKEREEVEQAHIMEYQEFNKNWDENLGQIEQQDQQALHGLEDRHVK